jgi:hypothetical protein
MILWFYLKWKFILQQTFYQVKLSEFDVTTVFKFKAELEAINLNKN